jgi:hypothetical protein
MTHTLTDDQTRQVERIVRVFYPDLRRSNARQRAPALRRGAHDFFRGQTRSAVPYRDKERAVAWEWGYDAALRGWQS